MPKQCRALGQPLLTPNLGRELKYKMNRISDANHPKRRETGTILYFAPRKTTQTSNLSIECFLVLFYDLTHM